jgi:hypothetical protein
MDRALPDACVDGHHRLIQDLTLPDPDDRHVLAAAIHADADDPMRVQITSSPST